MHITQVGFQADNCRTLPIELPLNLVEMPTVGVPRVGDANGFQTWHEFSQAQSRIDSERIILWPVEAPHAKGEPDLGSIHLLLKVFCQHLARTLHQPIHVSRARLHGRDRRDNVDMAVDDRMERRICPFRCRVLARPCRWIRPVAKGTSGLGSMAAIGG
jgi:hypothetical protein